jgi:hypothetical protein
VPKGSQGQKHWRVIALALLPTALSLKPVGVFPPFDRKRPTTRATVLFRSVRAGINDVWPGRSVVVIVVVTKGLPDLRKRPKGGI